MKAWFVSDLHLKGINERNGHHLLRFLHFLSIDEKTTHLFLLGDIFDFWVGDDDFYYKKYKPIINLILKLKEQGKKIYYFEGNHDLHIEKFWKNRMGIDLFVEDEYFNIDGVTIRAGHGDFINDKDLAYKRYRRVVRHPVLKHTVLQIPAVVFSEVGDWLSRFSRKTSSFARKDRKEEMIVMIRDYAKKCYHEKPFDFIITGHMHVLDEYVFNLESEPQKKINSINLGSWFDSPKALWISNDNPTREVKQGWLEFSGI